MFKYIKFYWQHKLRNRLIIIMVLTSIILLFNGFLRFNQVAINTANYLLFSALILQVIGFTLDTRQSNQMFIRLFVNPGRYLLFHALLAFLMTSVYQFIYRIEFVNADVATLSSIYFLGFYLSIPIIGRIGLIKGCGLGLKAVIVLGITAGLLLPLAFISLELFELIFALMVLVYTFKQFDKYVLGGSNE